MERKHHGTRPRSLQRPAHRYDPHSTREVASNIIKNSAIVSS